MVSQTRNVCKREIPSNRQIPLWTLLFIIDLIVMLIASPIAVYEDGRNIESIVGKKFSEIEGVGRSPRSYAIGVLLVWIIGMPLYIFYIRRKAKQFSLGGELKEKALLTKRANHLRG